MAIICSGIKLNTCVPSRIPVIIKAINPGIRIFSNITFSDRLISNIRAKDRSIIYLIKNGVFLCISNYIGIVTLCQVVSFRLFLFSIYIPDIVIPIVFACEIAVFYNLLMAIAFLHYFHFAKGLFVL